mmetsp:Transcript_18197/g.41611  ORF Transcript_18197/g.41611 Transcript_18197/m.41611 type:complete len:253 (+) Transcript_18197:499-1257(+)
MIPDVKPCPRITICLGPLPSSMKIRRSKNFFFNLKLAVSTAAALTVTALPRKSDGPSLANSAGRSASSDQGLGRLAAAEPRRAVGAAAVPGPASRSRFRPPPLPGPSVGFRVESGGDGKMSRCTGEGQGDGSAERPLEPELKSERPIEVGPERTSGLGPGTGTACGGGGGGGNTSSRHVRQVSYDVTFAVPVAAPQRGLEFLRGTRLGSPKAGAKHEAPPKDPLRSQLTGRRESATKRGLLVGRSLSLSLWL